MLLEELNHAQSGDDQAMLNLISKFLPLIKKYGRRLGYEDAANGNRQSRQRLDRHGTIVVGSCETFHHYNVQGVK